MHKFKTLNGEVELETSVVAGYLQDILDEKFTNAAYIGGTLSVLIDDEFVLLSMQKGLPEDIELLLAKLYLEYKDTSHSFYEYAKNLVGEK